MRWTQVNNCWECVFVNVPFKVRVWQNGEAELIQFWKNDSFVVDTRKYKTLPEAQADVENFVLGYLAQCSAQLHRECLEANVMTWRKLKEQLDQIPEDQLNEAIRVLDSDNDWFGEPSIVKAEEDKYSLEINGHDTKYTEEEQCIPEVEKGHHYLTIEL